MMEGSHCHSNRRGGKRGRKRKRLGADGGRKEKGKRHWGGEPVPLRQSGSGLLDCIIAG